MTVQPHPPEPLAAWLQPFLAGLTRPTWHNALILIAGAVLAPGRRTVAAMLRVTGLGQAPTFTNYHRVLNRNRWSGRTAARRLLRLLLATFGADGPVVIGIDETIERRWGPTIRVPWHLPRPGPFQPRPLRQGQRVALDLRHAARPDPLGRPRLGLAVPDRARPFGALRP
jgi:hypothetical protein